MSVESLFGKYCSSNRFAHDMRINSLAMQGIRRAREEPYSQGESCRSRSASPLICTSPSAVHGVGPRPIIIQDDGPAPTDYHGQSVSAVRDAIRERSLEPLVVVESDSVNGEDDSQTTDASLTSTLSMHHSAIRRDAYDRMLQGTAWHSIELISTGCNHSFPETEL